jgi:hypothetical protein
VLAVRSEWVKHQNAELDPDNLMPDPFSAAFMRATCRGEGQVREFDTFNGRAAID